MSRYVTKPQPIQAKKIVRTGVNSGYYQTEDGQVYQLKSVQVGKADDYLIFEDGVAVGIQTQEQFEQHIQPVPDEVDPVTVDAMIVEQDYMNTGELTICVLTLTDGRKISGVDNGIGDSKEEQRELAYHDAFNTLIKHEVYVHQGLKALFKEADNG